MSSDVESPPGGGERALLPGDGSPGSEGPPGVSPPRVRRGRRPTYAAWVKAARRVAISAKNGAARVVAERPWLLPLLGSGLLCLVLFALLPAEAKRDAGLASAVHADLEVFLVDQVPAGAGDAFASGGAPAAGGAADSTSGLLLPDGRVMHVVNRYRVSGAAGRVIVDRGSGRILEEEAVDETEAAAHADLLASLEARGPAVSLAESLSRKVVRNEVLPGAHEDRMHGVLGRSARGAPLWTPRPLSFRQSDEQRVRAHAGYCFNTRVSQSIPLDRAVPDYNSRCCQAIKYDLGSLPDASVIIVFHNEDLSVLLRSVHSVLNRSPPALLREIILVDDASNHTSHPWLGPDLDRYVAHLPKVALRRLADRAGLMMARVRGVEWARGDVVVFLDSHIECSRRWLEPLVARIAENRKNMVVPLIHTLDTETFEFENHAVSTLTFSWSLGQVHPREKQSDCAPMKSPVMAGGLFAADRAWFNELGGYDDEMRLYGGEEMEIGFKTWMCGGRLDALPCSRVGHVFRTGKYWPHQVYTVPGEEIHRNKLRVAAVWMDEYEDVVKAVIPKLPPSLPLGSIEKMQKIRRNLKCKSFKWYLDNVVPDLEAPNLENGYIGAIRNPATRSCLDSLRAKSAGDGVGSYFCHGQHGTQSFLLEGNGLLRASQVGFDLCIRPGRPGVVNWLQSLIKGDADQDGALLYVTGSCAADFPKWEYDAELQLLKYKQGAEVEDGQPELCLKILSKPSELSSYTLVLTHCEPDDERQKFVIDRIG